ncbi:MAG: Rab family GTPase [Microcoleaceae cyanobacterium]
MIYKKICLIGDFAVGKTSLVRRFVDRQFSDQYLSTIGVKISRKQVNLSTQETENPQLIQLMIWDVEGQTRFKEIAPSYLQGASGAIIVGDLTRQDTVNHIHQHIDLFLSINPQGVVIIAFNKIDLVKPELILQIAQDGLFFDNNQVISVYKTSAKTGIYVDEIFLELAQNLVLV